MTIEERLQELENKVNTFIDEKESVTVIKTVDSAGRLTLPKTIRKILGWEDESVEVEVSVCGKNILIKRVDK